MIFLFVPEKCPNDSELATFDYRDSHNKNVWLLLIIMQFERET